MLAISNVALGSSCRATSRVSPPRNLPLAYAHPIRPTLQGSAVLMRQTPSGSHLLVWNLSNLGTRGWCRLHLAHDESTVCIWMDNPERSQFLFSGGHVLTFILLELHNCVQQAYLFSYLGVHFAAHSPQEEMRVSVLPVLEAAQACSELSYECGEPQGTLAQKTF